MSEDAATLLGLRRVFARMLASPSRSSCGQAWDLCQQECGCATARDSTSWPGICAPTPPSPRQSPRRRPRPAARVHALCDMTFIDRQTRTKRQILKKTNSKEGAVQYHRHVRIPPFYYPKPNTGSLPSLATLPSAAPGRLDGAGHALRVSRPRAAPSSWRRVAAGPGGRMAVLGGYATGKPPRSGAPSPRATRGQLPRTALQTLPVRPEFSGQWPGRCGTGIENHGAPRRGLHARDWEASFREALARSSWRGSPCA